MCAVLDTSLVASPDIMSSAQPHAYQTLTTLFDLIGAFQDVTPPEADDVVVATVTNLLQAGHIRFVRQLPENN